MTTYYGLAQALKSHGAYFEIVTADTALVKDRLIRLGQWDGFIQASFDQRPEGEERHSWFYLAIATDPARATSLEVFTGDRREDGDNYTWSRARFRSGDYESVTKIYLKWRDDHG